MSETLVTAWGRARDTLRAAGVEAPVLDARLLVEAGAGVRRLDIVADPRRELTDAQTAGIEALVARRVAREPISHILGRKEFWTLEFAVTPAVLTPRPETETLIHVALQFLPEGEPTRVLDLGVGSGAILLSLLSERPQAHGIGLDISTDALAIAQDNANALKLSGRAEFHHGGWDAALGDAHFDLVVSNPPYIPGREIAALEPEVAKYEPRLALDGGADGLDAYRAIIPRLKKLLRAGGGYAFEVGAGQADTVVYLLGEAGLQAEQPARDLLGIPRVVWGRLTS